MAGIQLGKATDKPAPFQAGFQVGGGKISGLGNLSPGMFVGPNGAQQYQQWLKQQGYQTSGTGSPTDPLRVTTQSGKETSIPNIQMGGGYDVPSGVGGVSASASSSSSAGAPKFGYTPGQWAPAGTWQDALYQDALARQQKAEGNERGLMEDTLANEGWTDTSGLHMSAYGDIAERGGEARRGLTADSAERKRQAEQDEFQRWLAQEDLRLRASEIASRNQSASLSAARDESARSADAYYGRGGGASKADPGYDPFKKSVSQTSNASNATQQAPIPQPQRASVTSKPALDLSTQTYSELKDLAVNYNKRMRYGLTYTQVAEAIKEWERTHQGTLDYVG